MNSLRAGAANFQLAGDGSPEIAHVPYRLPIDINVSLVECQCHVRWMLLVRQPTGHAYQANAKHTANTAPVVVTLPVVR